MTSLDKPPANSAELQSSPLKNPRLKPLGLFHLSMIAMRVPTAMRLAPSCCCAPASASVRNIRLAHEDSDNR